MDAVWTRRLLVGVSLAMVAMLGAGIALTLPVNHGPDEPSVHQYAAYITECGGLPDPTAVDVVQSQHPPLFYTWLAAQKALLPDFDEGETVIPRSLRLPYERAVTVLLDQQGRVSPEAAQLRAARGEMPPERFPHVVRLSGVLLALVTAWLVFRGARAALPGSPTLATLAAATCVLVPHFGALFATPVNDQAAILLSTAAWAVLLRDAVSTRSLAVAGAFFGLAFLAKVLVVGPFAGALILVLGSGPAGFGARLKRMAILVAGPVVLAAWWFVRQMVLTGSPIATEITARHHPGFIRSDLPDAWELSQTVGGYARNYLGVLGGIEGMTPGELWLAVAAILPVLVILCGGVLAFGRRPLPRERLYGLAFLAAVVATWSVLLYGTRYFVVSEGRYLHILVLPTAVVLGAGLPRLVGRAARPLLAALAVLMALGGILLLHRGVIPRHHSDIALADVPGAVLYLDLGTPEAQAAVRAGRLQPYRGLRVHDADRRMVSGPGDRRRPIAVGAGSEDAPAVSVALDGLDPRDLHLVSLRLHPPLPTYEQGLRAMSHLQFAIGHAALTGLLSSHAVAGRWVHAALPPRAADAPAAILDGIGRGSLVGLSQLLVRRLPCRFLEARIADERVVIPLETVAPDFVLPLTVLLRAGDHVSAPGSREARALRRRSCASPGPPRGAGPSRSRSSAPRSCSPTSSASSPSAPRPASWIRRAIAAPHWSREASSSSTSIRSVTAGRPS